MVARERGYVDGGGDDILGVDVDVEVEMNPMRELRWVWG